MSAFQPNPEMIGWMRWWLCAVVLVACENASDFPGPPEVLEWNTIELAVHRGSIDRTDYQVDLPRGAVEQVIGRSATFNVYGLTVKIDVDPEARPIDDIVRDVAALTHYDLRDDGWSGVESGGSTVLNYVYVDEGALLCKATTTSANEAQTARMQRICSSLRATSGLGNPVTYPEGLAPSRVRAAMCQLAIRHVRDREPAPTPTKKRKTKEQLAAEAKRQEELDAAYSAREERCNRHRWSTAQINCLQQTTSPEEALGCAPGW